MRFPMNIRIQQTPFIVILRFELRLIKRGKMKVFTKRSFLLNGNKN